MYDFSWFPNWNSLIGATGLNGNSFPDGDMLPFGTLLVTGNNEFMNSSFSLQQERVIVSLWSIFRSPLIMGGDLRTYNRELISMLNNANILEINQHSQNNRQLWNGTATNNVILWTANHEIYKNIFYLAFFNVLVSQSIQVTFLFSEIGIPNTASVRVFDLWEEKFIGTLTQQFQFDMGIQGVKVFSLHLLQ